MNGSEYESDVGGQHCPCPVLVSFLSGFSGISCPLSVCCPDFCKKDCPMSFCSDFVCLDYVRCPDSVRNFRKNAVRCLSGRTRMRQSCPDFRCPCPPTSDTNHFDFTYGLSATLKRSHQQFQTETLSDQGTN